MAATISDSIGLLFPQALPLHSSIASWLSNEPLYDAVYQYQVRSTGLLDNAEILSELAELLTRLPNAGSPITAPQGPPDELAHDAFFHVNRMEPQNAPSVLLRSVLSARHTFLHEVSESEVTISHEELNNIDQAFADLLSCLLGRTVNSGRRVSVWKTPGLRCDAMRRWLKGHAAFAVLTQGLIVSLRALDHSLRAGQTEEVHRWADLAVSLFHGSKGAFLFTGDFAQGEYENTIRPSMSPPASPICLSGLMSADHRYLSQMMRDMRPVLKSLAEQEPEHHDQIVAALNGVYDSHVHVCERFVGTRPSILTEGRTERSGPSLIEQFRTLRLKPFQHNQGESRSTGNRARTTAGECPFHH